MKKLFLLMIVVSSSCSPVYVPNVRNSPLFTKEGEVQAALQLGNGVDLQGAVSLTNHIGLMTNFSYADRSRNLSDNQDDQYHRHKLLEGGLGYFQNDGAWCYEIFAGYGKGEGSNIADYGFFGTESAATGKFDRYFIQPAFGLNKKVMDVSFVTRMTLLDIKEFSNETTTVKIDDQPKFFIEPAVMGRVNLANNHLMLTFQAGVAIPVSSNIYFDYRPFQFSTGFGFRIGGIKKEDASVK